MFVLVRGNQIRALLSNFRDLTWDEAKARRAHSVATQSQWSTILAILEQIQTDVDFQPPAPVDPPSQIAQVPSGQADPPTPQASWSKQSSIASIDSPGGSAPTPVQPARNSFSPVPALQTPANIDIAEDKYAIALL